MARVASIALTHYDSDPRVRRMADARSHRGTSKLAYAAQYAAFFAAAGAIVSTLNARRPFDVVHLNAAGLDGHPITRLLSSEAQR